MDFTTMAHRPWKLWKSSSNRSGASLSLWERVPRRGAGVWTFRQLYTRAGQRYVSGIHVSHWFAAGGNVSQVSPPGRALKIMFRDGGIPSFAKEGWLRPKENGPVP